MNMKAGGFQIEELTKEQLNDYVERMAIRLAQGFSLRGLTKSVYDLTNIGYEIPAGKFIRVTVEYIEK